MLTGRPTRNTASTTQDVRATWEPVDLGGLAVLRSAMLLAQSVAHGFTLRPNTMRAATQRERLCRLLGGGPSRLVGMEQVHGCGVGVVEEVQSAPRIEGVDGLVTGRTGVSLVALSADCPIVIVCDPRRKVLGVAHAGWRGTVSGLTRRLVRTMIDRLRCNKNDLVAAIAPSAGPCCYEVGADVLDQAVNSLPDHQRFLGPRDGSVFFDLWSANIAQLRAAGLAPDRIDLAGCCTICDQRFFSYRRDGPTTGHAALMARLA